MGTINKLRLRAQANADYFGQIYVLFIDTSGNPRVERFDDSLSCHKAPGTELFRPKAYDTSKTKMLGD